MMIDILSRVGDILLANLNTTIDEAEDPGQMIDLYLWEYTNDIEVAEGAVARAVGNLRLAEDDLARAQEEVSDWGAKASAAANRATQSPSEAARFDELAKSALRRQIQAESRVASLGETVAQQRAFAATLTDALAGLRAKRDELIQKREELHARARMAEAQQQIHEAFDDMDVVDPTSDIGRMEEQVRQEEAMARGMAEVSASSVEGQFDALEASAEDLEVEARLAALRRPASTTSTLAG